MKDSVSSGKGRYALKNLRIPWFTDRSWDALCPDIASADTIDKQMSKVLIRTQGLVYTSRVDQGRPTKFVYASSKSLMLTSDKVQTVGAWRFGSPVTSILI